MRFAILASGSSANSIYVESEKTSILIDCGLSAKQTENRLRTLGINPSSIDAIMITHEHRDHISGVSVFSRRYSIPVFANASTAEYINNVYGIENFETDREFEFKDLTIDPFSVVHDASDPVAFKISSKGYKFAVVTDLGRITRLVKEKIKDVNAILLEANHDQVMLFECQYPWLLKQRIYSTHGHISNDTAGALLSDIIHPDLTTVFLGHISLNANSPKVALETVYRYISQTPEFNNGLIDITCAGRDSASPLVDIGQKLETRVKTQYKKAV